MKSKNRTLNIIAVFFLLVTVFLFVAPDILEARRGGGGSRRSFGGSRQKSVQPRSTQQKSTQTQRQSTPMISQNQKRATSFGGNRLTSQQAYTQKYGTPRKQSAVTGTNATGQQQRYIVNNYGGYGSGLMTGYMMGTTTWMWAMPFHPAFYYSRPYYHENTDGTVSVYPPTFSTSKLIFTIIIAGVILYIIYAIIRNKRRRKNQVYSQSSFG